jgi:cytochrome P450
VAPFCRFIITGHETTSTSTTWALFSLTQKPDVQQKLREELLQISTESPSMEDLMSLPYLDAVVREALRLHSPVSNLIKVAMKDDLVPLDTPFTDKNGNTQYTIRYVSIRSQTTVHASLVNFRVSKGDSIYIPVRAINRSKAVWGEDASEFK